RVEVTDDLSIARVYVRRETGASDERGKKTLLAGFEAAGHRLRREVAHAVGLRYAPNLRFFYDDAPDEVTRIEELLREVERDRKGSS
ncbi:MAG TPA: ribosome-binding factor A, partial [Minicystis sp.]|nr:ribosome-binding factor A [Minicystis sp.]